MTIITGARGTGKTTVAKALAQVTGSMVLEVASMSELSAALGSPDLYKLILVCHSPFVFGSEELCFLLKRPSNDPFILSVQKIHISKPLCW